MRSLLIGILSVVSFQAFARQHVSPADVCNAVTSISPVYGPDCAREISRSNFDQSALIVAHAAAKYPSYAVKILQISAGQYLDDNAGFACEALARSNVLYASDCVKMAINHAFDPALTDVAVIVAKEAPASAVSVIQNARGIAVHPGAAAVCLALAKTNPIYAPDCVTAIANKDYFNRTEDVCMSIAQRNSPSGAVACLKDSGVETSRRPGRRNRGGGVGPAPMPISLSAKAFRDLKRIVRNAQEALQRRDQRTAADSLQDMSNLLEEVGRQNNQ